MTRRRQPYQGRIAETRSAYQSNPDASLPSFASTPDEIQRAVERNSIKRGLFIIKNLVALDFNGLIQRVEQIAQTCDREEWYECVVAQV